MSFVNWLGEHAVGVFLGGVIGTSASAAGAVYFYNDASNKGEALKKEKTAHEAVKADLGSKAANFDAMEKMAKEKKEAAERLEKELADAKLRAETAEKLFERLTETVVKPLQTTVTELRGASDGAKNFLTEQTKRDEEFKKQMQALLVQSAEQQKAQAENIATALGNKLEALLARSAQGRRRDNNADLDAPEPTGPSRAGPRLNKKDRSASKNDQPATAAG